jgi:hypothetical protein
MVDPHQAGRFPALDIVHFSLWRPLSGGGPDGLRLAGHGLHGVLDTGQDAVESAKMADRHGLGAPFP